MKALDLDAVQAFVMIADLGSFTRAADALDSTQSAVSVKLKRLEAHLGHRLVERTPRRVRLAPQGETFLQAARALLSAHEAALGALATPQRLLKVGLSHHLVGADLALLLQRVHRADPALRVELDVASSREVEAAYDAGRLDAAIVLRHDLARRDGDTLDSAGFRWMAAPGWSWRRGAALRLATQAAPCGMRALAVNALDAAGIPWTDVFVSGGITGIVAAAQAGVAVAPLARRLAPAGLEDVGARLGLPPLPARDIVLYASGADRQVRAALRTFVAAFHASRAPD